MSNGGQVVAAVAGGLITLTGCGEMVILSYRQCTSSVSFYVSAPREREISQTRPSTLQLEYWLSIMGHCAYVVNW